MESKKLVCILKKKKNNFFSTIINKNHLNKKVLIKNSCGELIGIRGSKKYTTVAVESLGKDIFLKMFAKGLIKKNTNLELVLKTRVDKFVRSFLKGMMVYGNRYLRIKVIIEKLISHNGMRAKKKRRI